MKIRTYSELIQIPTFEERFEYLKLNGTVCEETYGFDRIVNQNFYHSKQWQQLRDKIIIRDEACDLGMPEHQLHSRIYIHHMNPIRLEDIINLTEYVMNPDYLICVSHKTHNAIHYGDAEQIKDYVARSKYDTCPWRN